MLPESVADNTTLPMDIIQYATNPPKFGVSTSTSILDKKSKGSTHPQNLMRLSGFRGAALFNLISIAGSWLRPVQKKPTLGFIKRDLLIISGSGLEANFSVRDKTPIFKLHIDWLIGVLDRLGDSGFIANGPQSHLAP